MRIIKKNSKKRFLLILSICFLIALIYILYQWDNQEEYSKYNKKFDYKRLGFLYISEDFSCYFPEQKVRRWTYRLWINFDTCEMSYSAIDPKNPDIDPIYTESFSEKDREYLITLLRKYDTLNWKPGIFYNDKSHGMEPAAYQLNPDAEYRKIGDYFRISSGPNQYYIGLSGEEKSTRENYYESTLRLGGDSKYLFVYSDEDDSRFLNYSSYGLPENYNEFMEDIWDFVFSHVDVVDYRNDLDENAIALRKERLQVKEGLPDINKMAYFSFDEFFGGFDSGIKVSLKFEEDYPDDVDKKILVADYHPYKEVYDMDKNGIPHLIGKPEDDIIQEISNLLPFRNTRDTDNEAIMRLINIIKKYKVLEWQDKSYYEAQPESAYVIQGDFFSMKPGLTGEERQMDEKEYRIRSTYNGFINLYDTEGRRISLQYDNNGVPEEYQEFRRELWDFAIDYMSEGDIRKKNEDDWRNYIDQAGRTYLELKK